MNNTPWMNHALSLLGISEIKGAQHNPVIVNFWKTIRMSGVKDDETPWCASFLGHCLRSANLPYNQSGWALSYATYGRALKGPAYGAIAVFRRRGGGHVGFVAGRDEAGNVLILGGNQSDRVSIARMPASLELVGYRWPEGVAMPVAGGRLPVVVATAEARSVV